MHLDIEKCDLSRGAHTPDSGKACVMELVSCLSGESWSDRPKCVSPIIAAFLRQWNDSLPDHERNILRPLIPVVMHTATSSDDESRREWMLMDWLVRAYTPSWLDLAGLITQADALRQGQKITTPEQLAAAVPSLLAARDSASKEWASCSLIFPSATALATAGASAGEAAWATARDKARATAGIAAWAVAQDNALATAGGAVPWDSAWAAAWAAACSAAEAKLRPTVASLQSSAIELVRRMAEVGVK